MDDSQPSSSGRSKRQKVDKSGRLSAFEKLKQLKGSKHKYEVEELENVYDEVDEKVYTKTVLGRQSDDWIVDDGGGGYVEDGREIFDDDLDEDSIQAAKEISTIGPRKKAKIAAKNKGNIKNLFMNMNSKSKIVEKLEDDDILGDLMSELKNEKNTPKSVETKRINKFAVASKPSVPPSRIPVSEPEKIEDNKEEIKMQQEEFEIEDDEEMMIFDDRKKNSSKLKVDKRMEKVLMGEQSLIQQIDNDENEEPNSDRFHKPIQDSNEISASQIIEDSAKDEVKELKPVFEDIPDIKEFEESEFTVYKTDSKKSLSASLCNASDVDMFDSSEVSLAWEEDFKHQTMETKDSVEDENVTLPIITNEAGEDVFRFFWWDAYEDPFKQPGVVYLFGKTYMESHKKYVSCCLMVKNIPRRIFLLPREQILPTTKDEEPKENTMEDVYEEFSSYAGRNGIREFRTCKTPKYYAFEREGTPKYVEYLHVRYSAAYPPMDSSYTGRAIEAVFGTSVNALELLLVERNIKGPCWLDVKCSRASENPFTWCKLQVDCSKIENISVARESQKADIPPMVVVTLNVHAALDTVRHINEIVMVAVLFHHNYHVDKAPPKPPFDQHCCIVTHPKNVPWPLHARDKLSKTKHTNVIRCESERELLEELLSLFQKSDPDFIIGYDTGFQFDLLMHRIYDLKVSNWSRVGKLKRSIPPMFKGKVNLGASFCGRPICDIQTSAKELNLKVRSYDLQSLCVSVLKRNEKECKEITPAECIRFYNSPEKLENLLRLTMLEASCILSIVYELNIIPLALQITCIAGNILSRTLSAGRAERNEFLLLHAFHERGYITPDKKLNKKGKDVQTESRRKKPAYAGGLVLDPKKGFYDKLILLMDFNSLYPSIIQEYNLCFTTVPGAAYAELEDLIIPESDLEPGVIPTEIRKLVQSRVQVKQMMNAPNLSPELKMQYNIRQMALKLTANSMYGCLGATHCRFYAKGLAALVTAKGREILQSTKRLVEKLNYEVIYGDTDSIMINTNIVDYDEVFIIGKKIKQEVNKLYKRVELDIDGVFKYLLLLQKKKYAAVTMTKSPSGQIQLAQEHKGLDIVRRDWCQLASEAGKNILNQLLCDQPSELRMEKIFTYLQTISKNIKENLVPLSALVITKQLSKDPKDYPDKKLVHVSVALRLNKEGGRMWKAGDTIPYIICDDGTNNSATDRAYHIDEFKKSETLKVDADYYLLSQVFPVVNRICDPIEGIDDALLAEHLGISHLHKSKTLVRDQEEMRIPMAIDEDKYKYCIPLKFKCQNEQCKTEIEIKDLFVDNGSGPELSLIKCSNPQCQMPPWTDYNYILNELQFAIRRIVNEYYIGWMECENPACSYRTRHIPLCPSGNYIKCSQCKSSNMHRVYSETQLYKQLSFYLHIFNLEQPIVKRSKLDEKISRDMRTAYDILKEHVEKQLRRNNYSVVDLDKLYTRSSSKGIFQTRLEEEWSDFEEENDEQITVQSQLSISQSQPMQPTKSSQQTEKQDDASVPVDLLQEFF